MDEEDDTTYILDKKLDDTRSTPINLQLSLLMEITENFSDNHKIGSGGYGVVYKGALHDGTMVAVKKLSDNNIEDELFKAEVSILMKARHKNIVRFIGYCADTQGIMTPYNGNYVLADQRVRLLCFEYARKGSLDNHITDESRGLEWYERYRVIRGICEGLHYLHEEESIIHLDFKPANILLDHNMVPKITDFGLSRLLNRQQTRMVTKNCPGSLGYMAPEYLHNGIITFKADIYSLGTTILEVITGTREQPRIEEVRDNWRKRLNGRLSLLSLEVYCEQVKRCIEIALNCMETNREKRPNIVDIIHQLNELETMIRKVTPCPNELGISIEQFHNEESIQVSVSDIPFKSSSEKIAEIISVAISKVITTSKNIPTAKIFDGVRGMRELPKRLEGIKIELTAMKNVIQHIDTKRLKEEDVKGWIGDVKKLAYNVEYVMDNYAYHQRHLQEGFMQMVGGIHFSYVFDGFDSDISRIERKIEQVIQLKEKWWRPIQLVPNEHSCINSKRSQGLFPKLVKYEDLVGIEGAMLELTGWLYSDKKSAVIDVCGMRSGIGKTTLVKCVYEQEKIKFPVHAWIVMSQIYNVKDLLRTLLRKIGYTEEAPLHDMDASELKDQIKRKVGGRRCLIVLDNFWDSEACVEMFDAVRNLSRVIITTRMSPFVSKSLAIARRPTDCFHVKPLSQADAFALFCRRAFYDSDCPRDLKVLAQSITDRCWGLPLLTLCIGSLMSSKQQTVHAWEQLYDQLCTKQEKYARHSFDHVSAALYFIYDDLPVHLKNCFLYCTMFPKYYRMQRECLVRLWVAEGFAVGGDNKAEDVADGYLNELISRNMLEVVEYDELGKVSYCMMLGGVHDQARIAAGREEFRVTVTSHDSYRIKYIKKEVRRLSTCVWDEERGSRTKFPCLVTLISLATLSSCLGMLTSIFSGSHNLTVLELQDSEITKVPESIGDLFNLRYIGLRRTKVKSLPESIRNLSNLITLDMKSTTIEKLPFGICKVKKLRHLFADSYVEENMSKSGNLIGVEPPKELCNLEELETLETVKASMDLAEQLKKLTQLQSVWIEDIRTDDCADLFATLSNMTLLSRLYVSASDDEDEKLCLESLNPTSTRLHRLVVRGPCAEGVLQCPIFKDHGRNLKYLALSCCYFRKDEDPLQLLALHVPNLIVLKLDNVNGAEKIVFPAGCLPNLMELLLRYMKDVKEIEIEDGALPCIERLCIVSLLNLRNKPKGIDSLRSLKELSLEGLHNDFIPD